MRFSSLNATHGAVLPPIGQVFFVETKMKCSMLSTRSMVERTKVVVN